MKTVYNLTDRCRPFGMDRQPKTLCIGTIEIPPGGFAQIEDDFPVNTIAGLIQQDMLSIDSIPKWYESCRQLEMDSLGVKPVSPVVEKKSKRRREER